MSHTEQNIWLRRFDLENVQAVLLNLREDADLIKTLRRQPNWTTDFEGEEAVIFARSAQKGKR